MCNAFISKFVSILTSVFNYYHSESPSQCLRIVDRKVEEVSVLGPIILKTRNGSTRNLKQRVNLKSVKV